MTRPPPNELDPTDGPWTGPSEWYRYRCRSCNHRDWVEEIVVDAFPPDGPGDCPILECPNCGGNFCCDPEIPTKHSLSHPDAPTRD